MGQWIACLVAFAILFSGFGMLAGCKRTDPDQTSIQSSAASSVASIESTTATTSDPTTSASSRPTREPVPATDAGDLTVLAINVGKADAILVLSGGRSFLIDTGDKNSVPQLFRALNRHGVERLDAVFLTHAHADHAGGLPSLAQGFPIGMLYSAEISQPDKDGNNKIAEDAAEWSLSHQLLKRGDRIAVTDDMAFEVIGPIVHNEADDNDNSLVLRLEANGRTVLFTGDMQFAEEETLLKDGTPLKADVLKVGNHGNPDATSEAFAAAVSPSHAIISTDTGVDTDSANPRVLAALGDAEILVTQDFAIGVQLTIRTNGSIGVANPPVPLKTAEIRIMSASPDEQTVMIRNQGDDVDLAGFFLVSGKDSSVFVFPRGAMLKAGQTATVSGQAGQGDFHWQSDGKLWKGKQAGAFALYDRHGNELSRIGE